MKILLSISSFFCCCYYFLNEQRVVDVLLKSWIFSWIVLVQLAQNRCQETMELLEFRRRILTDCVKEDETKRLEQQQQQVKQQQQLQQQQHDNDKLEVITNIHNHSRTRRNLIFDIKRPWPDWIEYLRKRGRAERVHVVIVFFFVVVVHLRRQSRWYHVRQH